MNKIIRFAVAAAVIASAPAPVISFAQQAVAPIEAPRFNITRFDVSGNTLLTADEVGRLVAPFTGSARDFADVQRALEAIERAYRDRGLSAVQVLLPEQDITKGVVRFQVIEPKIGRVVIEGNQFFDADNIRRSLPALKEGATPNSVELSRNLQLLAEHPTKQTTVTLRPGGAEDRIDVGVRVADEKPTRFFFTLDNTGTGETGYFRSGFGYQHSNLFNKDHVLTAQYITSPTQPEDVTIFGAGYRIPLYGWNSSVDFVAGYSDVDSGTVQGGLFNVSGSGSLALVRWNWYLPRLGQFEQKVTFGWDYRAYRSDVQLTGTTGTIVPDLTVHPLSIGYSGVRRYSDAELSYYASFAHNLAFGTDGDSAAFERSRVGANANYSILRYGANFVQALPAQWQFRAALNGQYTQDALTSYEQFGLGGPDSVRGYLLRELAGDKGYNTQVELYTPDLAGVFKMSESYRLRFLGFYDFGSFEDNSPPRNAGQEQANLYSMGLGMRLSFKKLVSLRLDAAHIMQPTVNRQSSSTRLTGALAVVF
ncbi:MAG: ShlB/FhaC/HecB family hemolysin secretion/activation protein [Burkholderiales bacterium]|nr:ShlB/FhaC/HecB family hemolysin secretion/activation protein [Burkholderiales bacterium]